MKPAKFDDIANDVVRPGIEKMLVPLALYRGQTTLGRIQAKWNFAIAMMHSECESFGDGVKISNNPSYAHLCEPHTNVQHLTMWSFFNRLRDHPTITDNIPGLTEYARMLRPNGEGLLTKIPLYAVGSVPRVPWRLIAKKQRGTSNLRETPVSQLFYPYVIHKPKKDDGAFDMMVLVNSAVPKSLPPHIRADICQDLIVGLLSGEITADEIKGSVKSYSKKVFEMHPLKYGHLSFDAEMFEDGGKTLYDVVGA